MVMQGETILTGARNHCCGKTLELRALMSAAGWYIGTACSSCGPHSRESGYFLDEASAELALQMRSWVPRGFDKPFSLIVAEQEAK